MKKVNSSTRTRNKKAQNLKLEKVGFRLSIEHKKIFKDFAYTNKYTMSEALRILLQRELEQRTLKKV